MEGETRHACVYVRVAASLSNGIRDSVEILKGVTHCLYIFCSGHQSSGIEDMKKVCIGWTRKKLPTQPNGCTKNPRAIGDDEGNGRANPCAGRTSRHIRVPTHGTFQIKHG